MGELSFWSMTDLPLERPCGPRLPRCVSKARQKLLSLSPWARPVPASDIRDEVDDILCLHTPVSFIGVGQYYEDFSQTSDEEVRELLTAPAAGGPEADV